MASMRVFDRRHQEKSHGLGCDFSGEVFSPWLFPPLSTSIFHLVSENENENRKEDEDDDRADTKSALLTMGRLRLLIMISTYVTRDRNHEAIRVSDARNASLPIPEDAREGSLGSGLNLHQLAREADQCNDTFHAKFSAYQEKKVWRDGGAYLVDSNHRTKIS